MRTQSLAALTGAALAIGFDAFYVWVFEREGGQGNLDPGVRLIAGSIAAAAALLVASVAIQSRAVRAGVLAASTGVLSAWAVVASLSVGIFLLPAAILALLALMDVIDDLPRGSARLPLILGAGSALVAVAFGLELG